MFPTVANLFWKEVYIKAYKSYLKVLPSSNKSILDCWINVWVEDDWKQQIFNQWLWRESGRSRICESLGMRGEKWDSYSTPDQVPDTTEELNARPFAEKKVSCLKQSFSIFHYPCSGKSVFVQRRNLGTNETEQPSPPLHPPKVGGLLSHFDKYKSLYSRNMSEIWFLPNWQIWNKLSWEI